VYQLSELQTFVYRDLAQASTNNDRLPTADVTTALNSGYKEVALRTRCFIRTATIPLTTGTATYSLPQDMSEPFAASYGTTSTLLRWATMPFLTWQTPTWRATAAGTPTTVYLDDQRNIGLYPPPSFTGSKSLLVVGFVMPFKIGGGITTLSRTTNVTTGTVTAAHNLTTSDLIAVSGCADTAFNTTSAAVVSVPTSTTFTYANTGSNDTDTTANLFYATGVPYLYASTDIPKFLAGYHMALVDFAVWTLASRFIAGDSEAQVRAQAAKGSFDTFCEGLKTAK